MRKGAGKKVNGSLFLVMIERNEHVKRNGQWKDRKEQPKMAKTRANGTKMNANMLVEAEDRRKRTGGRKYYWRNGVKKKQYIVRTE